MKRYVFVILLLFIVCSCSDKKTSVEAEKEVFPLAKSEYTILHFSENKVYIFENVKETTLSDKELILIEKLFQKMRIDHNAKLAASRIKYNKDDPYGKSGLELEIKGFKRQYLPVINSKGEKEVWINFFCDEHLEGSWWKTKRYLVLDGGNCYYNLKVNLATNKIYDLAD